MRWLRRGAGKLAVGLIAGACFFAVVWIGLVGTGRAGWFGLAGTGRAGAGTSTLCSGAGGVVSGTLGSGAGSGVVTGDAVARFKIWAIWMYAFVMLEP